MGWRLARRARVEAAVAPCVPVPSKMRTGSGARLDVKATGDGGYWRYLAREHVDATDRNKRPGTDGAPGSGTRIPEHRNEQPPRSQGSPDRGRPQPPPRTPRPPQPPPAPQTRQHTQPT